MSLADRPPLAGAHDVGCKPQRARFARFVMRNAADAHEGGRCGVGSSDISARKCLTWCVEEMDNVADVAIW